MSRPRPVEFLDTGQDGGRAAPGAEIAPGIVPLVLPLDFGPKRVTCWLLRDGDGWTVVDCGADTPGIRRIWADVLHGALGGDVRRIVATHGHVDHVGHAGPLWEATGRPPFLITRTEWLSASLRGAMAGRPARGDRGDFFRLHGVPEAELPDFTAMPAALGALAPLPDRFVRIAEGDVLRIGGRDWRVMTAGGHAPEHAALYCAEEALLIAGDQVLPRITPFVGVFPAEPDADPLGEFLAALDRFGALAEETLVLPAHGPAFRGLHARLAQLRAHHDARLSEIAALAARPVSAYRIAAQVFPRAMAGGHRRLALAETLAHLNLLCGAGRMVRRQGADGGVAFLAA